MSLRSPFAWSPDLEHDTLRAGEGRRSNFPVDGAPQDLGPGGPPGEPRHDRKVPGLPDVPDHASGAVDHHHLPGEASLERVLDEGGRLPVRPHPEVG